MEQRQRAFVVIDMQRDYIGAYPEGLTDRINKRIVLAGSRGEIVIYVRNRGRKKKEAYVSDFADGLLIVSDFIVEKARESMFESRKLRRILREHDIESIELAGIDGNSCVAASAIEASKMGYSVSFPLACIGIKNRERFEKTRQKLLQNRVVILDEFDCGMDKSDI